MALTMPISCSVHAPKRVAAAAPGCKAISTSFRHVSLPVTCLRRQNRAPKGRVQQHIVAAASVEADAPPATTKWFQKTISLPSMKRGCHVMTRDVADKLPEIGEFEVGMANFFLLHTSASLTINENASPDVPLDLNDALDKIAPEGSHYRHLDEGYDDMPAHVKSSLMGASLDIPISRGRLALGTWQGIYLNEHRNHGGSRQVVVTIQGRKRADGQTYGRYR